MGSGTYTVEEANALLPYLAPTLVELRQKLETSKEIEEAMARAAAGNGWSAKRERWARTLARVGELVDRIEEWEIEVRDLDRGIVDFPADIGGQEAYLCWRLGEPTVAHWHRRDEGFASRRSL